MLRADLTGAIGKAKSHGRIAVRGSSSGLTVKDKLRTSASNVYGAGDVLEASSSPIVGDLNLVAFCDDCWPDIPFGCVALVCTTICRESLDPMVALMLIGHLDEVAAVSDIEQPDDELLPVITTDYAGVHGHRMLYQRLSSDVVTKANLYCFTPASFHFLAGG